MDFMIKYKLLKQPTVFAVEYFRVDSEGGQGDHHVGRERKDDVKDWDTDQQDMKLFDLLVVEILHIDDKCICHHRYDH